MARKLRKKRDGTTEQVGDCPLCGSRSNYEVNLSSGLFSCWACGYRGKVGVGTQAPQVQKQLDAHPPEAQETYPEYALRAIRDRGFDPDYLIYRYRIFWDGDRICWPSGPDGRCARRAVFPWEEPKVLAYGERGIIGYHLMVPGSHLVLTEGDYKAASIPLPFVGLGIQGTSITPDQVQLVKQSRPGSLIVALDGGKEVQAWTVAQNFWMYGVRVVTLPGTSGPDDIARSDLMTMLLNGADKESK